MVELRSMGDGEIVQRVLDGETEAYEVIMRRHNQRLYRTARAILRDDDEAEDVLQETYVRAFQHLDKFAGDAQLSTWLTRIAVNEALSRLRKRKRQADWPADASPQRETMDVFKSHDPGPEELLLEAETRAVLESAIDALPGTYRIVFMMREIEGMSTSDTAESLDISEEAVKVRLHRARHMLRRTLFKRAGAVSTQAFQFMGERCNRVVQKVLAKLEAC